MSVTSCIASKRDVIDAVICAGHRPARVRREERKSNPRFRWPIGGVS